MSLENKGLRKLLAFLVIAAIAAAKLTGPDLVQALIWSFAVLSGGNAAEHFAKVKGVKNGSLPVQDCPKP